MEYTKEQIIRTLKDAPLITAETIAKMKSCKPEKVKELQEKQLPHIKGVWVFTKYRNDEFPNLLIDADISAGEDEVKTCFPLWDFIPHDGCFKLSCEVFGEEPNMFIGTEEFLQKKIMTEGEIQKVYTVKGWGEAS